MSATRYAIPSYKVLSAGTMTGTSVLTATSANVSNVKLITITVVWTGTPNGTFVISGSSNAGTTYDTLNATASDGSALTATGSAGNHTIQINPANFDFVKVTYTNSSSTGSLDVWLKGLGE